MDWAFFHFARQVEGCGEEEVWVCPSEGDGEVEAADIDVCCCERLLPDGHWFCEFGKFFLGGGRVEVSFEMGFYQMECANWGARGGEGFTGVEKDAEMATFGEGELLD